jgi:hypothetical protein
MRRESGPKTLSKTSYLINTKLCLRDIFQFHNKLFGCLMINTPSPYDTTSGLDTQVYW